MTNLTERAQQVGFHRAALEAGATITDGKVDEPFTKGWAHACFTKGKMIAHYYARTDDLGDGAHGYTSECGHLAVSTPRVPLLKPGNLPFCKRCENKLMKDEA